MSMYWSIKLSDPSRIDALGDDALGPTPSHNGELATRIMRPGAVLTSAYSEEFG